jgi:hypothetical protein
MRGALASKQASAEYWPIPKPIPNDLARVDAFVLDFLPDRLAPWIDDIASRLQCPPEYPAITSARRPCRPQSRDQTANENRLD